MKFSFEKVRKGKRFVDEFGGAKEHVVGRVKDEIVRPLVSLPRQLIVGTIASLFVAVGIGFILVGSLRLVQHFWAFQGNTAWLAYAVVWFEALLIGAFTLWRILSGTSRSKKSGS